MIATYRVLSVLLSYPQIELRQAVGELVAALDNDRLVSSTQRRALQILIDDITQGDILDAQSRYVDLFDRTRALSLHLFEHVHGESRDRGQAMVSLLQRYQVAGFDISTNELPDYIPLFLEFLSVQSVSDANVMLTEPAHILAALGERLRARDSSYAAVFETLLELSQATLDKRILSELREAKIEDPHDLVAVDENWEETEVLFGPNDAAGSDCSRVDEILRKIDASASQPLAEPRKGL